MQMSYKTYYPNALYFMKERQGERISVQVSIVLIMNKMQTVCKWTRIKDK